MLVSVEAWPDEVVVRARGLPSERTALLEREFGKALEGWHRQGRDREAVPARPAERIFEIDVSVADDAGTAYSPMASTRGVPGPPQAARSLVVRIDPSARASNSTRAAERFPGRLFTNVP